MNLRYPSLFSLVLFAGIIALSSCKKSDPAPLGAQTNAVLLAGDKGKTKNWKLTSFTYTLSGSAAQNLTLDPCFSDNLYTFSNNDAQTYSDGEGAATCTTGSPAIIETGFWAFSLDGKNISIAVNSTYSGYGLFSPEAVIGQDSSGNDIAFNIGYPFPAAVTTLSATQMVLTQLETAGSSTYIYTLTFAAQ